MWSIITLAVTDWLDGTISLSQASPGEPPKGENRGLRVRNQALRALFRVRRLASPEGVHYRCLPAMGVPSLPR
jgi:hypothetical protein